MMARSRTGWHKVCPGLARFGSTFYTPNAVPGQVVHGESIRRWRGKEWRQWDAHRSKLAALLSRSKYTPVELLPQSKNSIVYLGAGHGSTISYLYDYLLTLPSASSLKQQNPSGVPETDDRTPNQSSSADLPRIIAVDPAPRCLRNLIQLSEQRAGIVPILADARKTHTWKIFLPQRVTWLFQDVAISGQAELFVSAAQAALAAGGLGILSFKSHSERIQRHPAAGSKTVRGEADSLVNPPKSPQPNHSRKLHESAQHRRAALETARQVVLDGGLELLEVCELKGFEEAHWVLVLRAPATWPSYTI